MPDTLTQVHHINLAKTLESTLEQILQNGFMALPTVFIMALKVMIYFTLNMAQNIKYLLVEMVTMHITLEEIPL
ncbi:MAG: Uncharacterised protein [Formosa sp. Hel3_A1_48]|nr:MAG: Uncharacterised protein [Formosa sp. Hel3_A1_48]